MGNKSSRKRKHILHYLALGCVTAAIGLAACAPVQDKITEIRTHQQLEEYRGNLAAGFFETVIQQSEQVLAEDETAPAAAVALYSLGEVYAHHDYAGRDYQVSQHYFEKLINNFPESPLTSEARTYISFFDTIAAQEKAVAAAENKSLLQEKQATAAERSAADIRLVIENRNFDQAVQQNQQILKEAGRKKPADEALYNLGLIYAHVDNPVKDYQKSQDYFHALIKQFPDSAFAEEARVWLGLFETIEKIQQIDLEIEQQKKQLTR